MTFSGVFREALGDAPLLVNTQTNYFEAILQAF